MHFLASLSRSMYLGLQGDRRATASQAGWADGQEPGESSPLFTRGEWGRSGVTASYFIHLHEASCHFVVCWLGWINFVAMLSLIIFCMSWLPSLGLSCFPRNQEINSFPSRMSRWTRARGKQSLVHQGGTGRSFSHPFWWGLSDQSQN